MCAERKFSHTHSIQRVSLQCECLDAFLRYFFWLKAIPHSIHLKGFSLIWIFLCSIRFDLPVKVFPHSLHIQGFPAVWVLWCLWWHLTSEWKLCHNLCTQKMFFSSVNFLMSKQVFLLAKGLFTIIIFKKLLSSDCFWLKALPHSLYLTGFYYENAHAPHRFDLWSKSFPHTWQTKGVSLL
jgi:hypothetical protein